MQSIAQAQALLEKYYAALEQISLGKSFTFSTENGTRTVTYENINDIRSEITRLERRVSVPSGQRHNHGVANFNHTK